MYTADCVCVLTRSPAETKKSFAADVSNTALLASSGRPNPSRIAEVAVTATVYRTPGWKPEPSRDL